MDGFGARGATVVDLVVLLEPHLTRLLPALLICLAACVRDRPPEVTATDAGSMCPGDPLRDGGAFFETEDGTQLWYALEGPDDAPVVVMLHGGPGGNTRTFRHALAPWLEPHLRVLYLDQRGCGRSFQLGEGATLGMDATVDDLEALRTHLGLQTLHLVGHSFGGLVASAYAQAHPEHTGRIIFVDTLIDVGAALEHQVQTLARISDASFPDHADALKGIAASSDSSFERLGRAYELLGRFPLQRALHFATDEAQQAFETFDAQTSGCTLPGVPAAYAKEGWLGEPKPQPVFGDRAIVFAGAASEVIGRAQIERAAASWQSEVRWFEHSGHFIYWEEPRRFARELRRFVATARE